MSPATARRHVATYRALLVLYPRSFRRDYRDPMVQLFSDRLRDVGGGAWLRIAPDLVRSVPSQRIEAAVNFLSSGGRALALAAVALVAAAAALGRGGVVLVLAAIVGIAVLFTQRDLFSSLRRGDRAPLRHAAVQSWWAPVATLMGFLLVLFGIGTAFEAHNWGGRIAGSSLSVLLGVAMLIGLKRRPFARASGNALILIATIPFLLFFWMLVPPILAIIVWIGVVSGGFEERPAIV